MRFTGTAQDEWETTGPQFDPVIASVEGLQLTTRAGPMRICKVRCSQLAIGDSTVPRFVRPNPSPREIDPSILTA